jgi:putative ABC transport system substrate-binding protein
MQRRTFLGGSAAILASSLCRPYAFAEQPTKLPVIGFLGGGSAEPSAAAVAAFRQGLSETGYLQASIRIVNFL